MTGNRAGFRWSKLVLVGAVLLGFGAAGYGCGGSDKPSGEDLASLCKQSCDKALSLCFPDAGDSSVAMTVRQLCTQECSKPHITNPSTCKNSSAIANAFKACLDKKTCDEYTACGEALPACEGSTGGTSGGSGGGGTTGGSGGSIGGGSGGSSTGGGGGAGGAGGTATCADLLACCNASTNATLKAVCMMGYTQAMPSGDATCSTVLESIKPSVCP